MSTNVLAIPLAQMTVQTGTNEDWIDSILYVVGPEPIDSGTPQLDLRGINFEMEVRRTPTDHEVILSASIDEGTLAIGPAPDFGYLLIMVPEAEMITKVPGTYVADIVASADGYIRRTMLIDLTIVEGVTK